MKFKIILLIVLFTNACTSKVKPALVFQSDFGLANNTASSMFGSAAKIDPTLRMYNLTHDIPSYDIWLGSLMLAGSINSWPKGTVYISVIDPGVGGAGSERVSVVAKTKTGHYIVTPDNGTLTFVEENFGIEELREIKKRDDSEFNALMQGNEVYTYTGARLASGIISFEEVGAKLDRKVVVLPYTKAKKITDNTFEGTISMIYEPYGNLYSNIDKELFLSEGVKVGDMFRVRIWKGTDKMYEGSVPFVNTYSDVAENKALIYLGGGNQVVTLGLNMGDFARTYNIDYGYEWKIEVERVATLLNK